MHFEKSVDKSIHVVHEFYLSDEDSKLTLCLAFVMNRIFWIFCIVRVERIPWHRIRSCFDIVGWATRLVFRAGVLIFGLMMPQRRFCSFGYYIVTENVVLFDFVHLLVFTYEHSMAGRFWWSRCDRVLKRALSFSTPDCLSFREHVLRCSRLI